MVYVMVVITLPCQMQQPGRVCCGQRGTRLQTAPERCGLKVWIDPFWLDTKQDPHRAPYVQEAVLGPTFPSYNGFNPAWGQVSAEQLWGQAHADVIKNGMTAQAAVDKAFKRAEAIF